MTRSLLLLLCIQASWAFGPLGLSRPRLPLKMVAADIPTKTSSNLNYPPVYLFGKGRVADEATKDMKSILGGKGVISSLVLLN